MLAWLCMFTRCRWLHVQAGLWQCTRCKTVSVGRLPATSANAPERPHGAA